MRGFKRGALVTLRSGGPEMVIERIDRFQGSPERYAHCKWFDKLRVRTERFVIDVLELSLPAPDQPPRRAADAHDESSAGEAKGDAHEDGDTIIEPGDGDDRSGAAHRRGGKAPEKPIISEVILAARARAGLPLRRPGERPLPDSVRAKYEAGSDSQGP